MVKSFKILAADIGGTSSRFAVFEGRGAGLAPRAHEWLETASAESFSDLLQQLFIGPLSGFIPEISTVVVAAAGPIEEAKRCLPPNINWTIELRELSSVFPGRCVYLINDFAAQAYACLSPVKASAKRILPGAETATGPLAVIGAGTGLGKAALVFRDDGGPIVIPSEGGHSSFPAERLEEWEILDFVKSRTSASYVTCEDLVSGRGLSHIHAYCTGEDVSPEQAASGLLSDGRTLELAARFYGRVCRNFALEVYATGGVYVAGGVAAKNPVLVQHRAFAEAFWDSAVYGELLRRIPLYLLDDQQSGLWGAAYLGSIEDQRIQNARIGE